MPYIEGVPQNNLCSLITIFLTLYPFLKLLDQANIWLFSLKYTLNQCYLCHLSLCYIFYLKFTFFPPLRAHVSSYSRLSKSLPAFIHSLMPWKFPSMCVSHCHFALYVTVAFILFKVVFPFSLLIYKYPSSYMTSRQTFLQSRFPMKIGQSSPIAMS